jgi:outer membrane protein TolC
MPIRIQKRRLALAGLALLADTLGAGLMAQGPAPPQPYARHSAGESPTPNAAPAPDTRPASFPVDLATALRLADANNPTVGVARARVKEAVAQLDRARVSWIPNLTFGPNFFYHDGIDQNRRGDIFTVARGFYSLGVGPTVRVDLSDALYLPLVARQGVRAAEARANATSNATQLDVAIAYLDLVELHGLLAVNADILDRTEQVLRSAEAGARAGLNKTAADVNRAQTEANLRRQEGVVLRGRAAAAAARLARLLALDPAVELVPFEVAVVPLILVPGHTTLEQLVQTALRGRPEVAAAHAQVAAAETMLRQSKVAPYLPRVQGEFIGGGLSGGRNDDFSPLQSQYNAGVALVWNLEAFGLGNAASIRGRQAGLEAELYRLRETEALVSSQVVEAAQTAAARFATLGLAQEAVRQAQEMYRKFRDASFGMVGPKAQFDALEPLTAVQALNQARTQYLQQVVEFNRSQFRLYAAIGQPALGGLDGAVPQGVEVPPVPAAGKVAPAKRAPDPAAPVPPRP